MTSHNNLISTIHDSQKTLFILCGFPYAGKSYVARQVQAQVNIEFISIDDIFYSRGFDWSTNKLPNPEEWQNIFDESYQKTKAALGAGRSVLYDSTNQTLSSRDKLRELAKETGAESVVIHVKTPIETVWLRWEENQKTPTRSVVSRELVQMTIDMFEEPTEKENIIVIEN